MIDNENRNSAMPDLTPGETEIMKAVLHIKNEIGGEEGIRVKLTQLDGKLNTHIELHKQREAFEKTQAEKEEKTKQKLWDVIRPFLSPTAVLAALYAVWEAKSRGH